MHRCTDTLLFMLHGMQHKQQTPLCKHVDQGKSAEMLLKRSLPYALLRKCHPDKVVMLLSQCCRISDQSVNKQGDANTHVSRPQAALYRVVCSSHFQACWVQDGDCGRWLHCMRAGMHLQQFWDRGAHALHGGSCLARCACLLKMPAAEIPSPMMRHTEAHGYICVPWALRVWVLTLHG